MKKLIAMLLCALMLIVCAVPFYGEELPAGITSQAFYVIDAHTGAPLFGYNEDQPFDPASVTKVMTVGLACEKARGDWSTALTVTHDDVHTLWKTDSSHIALQEGEVVVLEDMLYAAIIASANDACNVLAEYISEDGTIAGGVAAMNAKAQELGLENTHFANPHGISEEGHYISAKDLTVILRWALQQPGFYKVITQTDAYYMDPTNRQEQERAFWMHDYMRLPGSQYYIPEVVGSKMGYTDKARYTYVCLAEKDGVQVICAVMKSELKTDKYRDVAAILDYTFSNFRSVEIPAQSNVGKIDVRGGGAVLGQADANAMGTNVLLHNRLTEQAVEIAQTQAEYVIGGMAPQVSYKITGDDIQMDSIVQADMSLSGLEEVFQHTPEKKLENKGSANRVKPSITAFWLMVAAVGVAVSVLWALGRLRNGRKQLRRFIK